MGIQTVCGDSPCVGILDFARNPDTSLISMKSSYIDVYEFQITYTKEVTRASPRNLPSCPEQSPAVGNRRSLCPICAELISLMFPPEPWRGAFDVDFSTRIQFSAPAQR